MEAEKQHRCVGLWHWCLAMSCTTALLLTLYNLLRSDLTTSRTVAPFRLGPGPFRPFGDRASPLIEPLDCFLASFLPSELRQGG